MTQTEQIRKHLERHNSITPMQALERYGCMRLAARICDLKSDGFHVLSVPINKNGKRYAKYVRAWA